MPEPERLVIPFVTCVGISRVIERFEEAECLSYQTIIGEACGCPDAPADNVCRICGGDTRVDNPEGAVDLSEDGLDNVPCIFYEVIANDQEIIEEEGYPCGVFQLDRETCCALPSEPDEVPENLAELCTEDLIAGNLDAYLQCALPCLGSRCCDPALGDQSCLSTSLSVCEAYAPCAVLQEVELPDPVFDSPAPEPTGSPDAAMSDGTPAPIGAPVAEAPSSSKAILNVHLFLH